MDVVMKIQNNKSTGDRFDEDIRIDYIKRL